MFLLFRLGKTVKFIKFIKFIKPILIPRNIRKSFEYIEIFICKLKFMSSSFKKTFIRIAEIQYLTNYVSIDETENQEIYEDTQNDVEVLSDDHIPEEMQHNNGARVFSGLLKIFIFFFTKLMYYTKLTWAQKLSICFKR